MKIKCPDCSTSYDIKPEILGTDGRSVKCARCGNRWFVRPKTEKPASGGGSDPKPEPDSDGADEAEWDADEAEEERAAAGKAAGDDTDADAEEAGDDDADDDQPAAKPAAGARAKKAAPPAAAQDADDAEDDDDDTADRPIDIETMAKRPKIKVNPNKFKRSAFGAVFKWLARRNYRRISGILLFAVAVAACGFVVVIRDSIVKEAPDLASLFEFVGLDVNLRGLEFRDLRTFSEVEEGKQVLVVEGTIRNIGEEVATVPAVRLSIRGTDLQEIYAWTVEPRTTTLKGLDETRFRTILSEPPGGASDIHVRFIDRGQRQVILE